MSVLYKYIANCSAIEHLLAGTVKFTPIPELNDPSELVPFLDQTEVAESLSRLRREGYCDADMDDLRRQAELLQVLAPQFQAIDVPPTKELATEIIRSQFYSLLSEPLEQLLYETAREMSSKVGLFCLSRRFDSLPMWAHYAQNAAGLIVEFQGLNEVFTGDSTGILAQPIPVTYDRERGGVTFNPRSHESIFFSKFSDWRYEEEVRVVLPLAKCSLKSTEIQSLYLYQMPQRHVSRLILGWNMPPADVTEITHCARNINPAVTVVQARCVRGKVELG
jgi:hypothetical protein